MRKHRWIAVSAFLVLTGAAPFAAAADSPPAVVHDDPHEQGYQYNFKDDPLQAAGLESLGARIRVASRAARDMLIRPRTAFVVELLKSVEHL